jgi:ATP-dependent Clp protease ATP-binding subunit ClpC
VHSRRAARLPGKERGRNMFERFTERARRVVAVAQDEARSHRHGSIGTEHLLLGLIDVGEGAAVQVLGDLGIGLDALRREIEEMIGQGSGEPLASVPFTPQAKKVLELSLREALQLGHNHIGTEHLLLGLIREGEGVAARALVKLGASLAATREQVTVIMGVGPSGETRSGRGARVVVRTDVLEDMRSRLDAIVARLDAIERHLGMGKDPDVAGET